MIEVKETDRDERPCYRVDFWERPAPGYAWNSDIWIIEDAANVSAVIDWAESHARERSYQLLVKNRASADGSYTVLAGDDPNDPS